MTIQTGQQREGSTDRKPVPTGPVAGTTQRMPRIRRIIAQRMTESLTSTAQLTAVQEADVTELGLLRDRVKVAFRQREGAALTYLSFFCRALVRAAQDIPEFNASIDGDGKTVTYHGAVHLGVAVDTPAGLMVPVLRNAEALSLAEIARGIADVALRVRAGTASPEELSGSTLTISNIGGAGSLSDTPIINYPEVAILGTGAVVRRPRVLVRADGIEEIVVRSVCALPITYDHRLIDGAAAGRFLTAVRGHLSVEAFEGELAAYLH
ncbi:2-oxo acid dehydrogenase subunit E2 [Rhodococcus sp. P1Y]|uniref:2-oxo acid dehydrogenase subunit E2 n=1 Tax=Rhodococcus sp. P1Y TaxID=1302308 RepID=UPI0019125E34|nr:2-oxo acid dehydrogenase subunit E2 [Rhodococcus sp. P1Y]